MRKKLVILGRGTAGCLATAHFAKWLNNYELEWHFDPSIPTQSVGEGASLSFPRNLFSSLTFTHGNLINVNGTYKTGIAKEGWGKTGEYFFHDFPPPFISYHFNAVMLQDYVFSLLKNRVKIVEHNITSDRIDADMIKIGRAHV